MQIEELSLVLILMRMSKAFRIRKYPSVLVLGTSRVEFSTHEHAWIYRRQIYEKSVEYSERSLAAFKCLVPVWIRRRRRASD